LRRSAADDQGRRINPGASAIENLTKEDRRKMLQLKRY
jgi:hypothetical protein